MSMNRIPVSLLRFIVDHEDKHAAARKARGLPPDTTEKYYYIDANAHATPVAPDKPVFNNERAMVEGWCVSECDGYDDGPWQLQMYDDADVFETDAKAWLFVCRMADDGSVYHRKAMQFLQDHNPIEHAKIVAFFLKTKRGE